MIADIIRREGGYNDIVGDRGGATNLGVSLKYAARVGLDLDHDGDVDKADIRLVTPQVAADLYKQDFFISPGISKLPPALHAQMFDMAVNHGPPRPIMWLQKIFGLEDDGVLGPKTLSYAWAYADLRALNNALVQYRISFYQGIVRRDPTQGKFLKGWLKRANEFVLP